MGKRGQFTVFVILGFILLVVVIFTLFIVSMIQDQNINQQARKAVNDYVDASSINYYIYTCMDKVVNEAVLEIASQGGVFYNETGGFYNISDSGVTHIELIKNPDTTSDKLVNVSYAVFREGSKPANMFYEPWWYPFEYTRISELRPTYDFLSLNSFRSVKESGVFGFNNFTRLCHSRSVNYNPPGIFGFCKNNVEEVITKNISTIEVQLAEMLVHKMNNCTNFSIFEEIGDHNITLKGDPSVEIIYGAQDMSFVFNYPFEVKIKNREPVIVRRDFNYYSSLKFVSLHNYLLNLVKEEVQNPYFNLKTDYGSIPGFDSVNYELEVLEHSDSNPIFKNCADDCDWKHDFILKIIDKASESTGKLLTYYVAFQNRRPALDWIHETDDAVPFDYIVFEGEELVIDPYGFDPENKDLQYIYSGWKETYTTTYNLDHSCNPPIDWLTFINCIEIIPNPSLTDLFKWSKSQSYLDTQRKAEYTIGPDDAGLHSTRLTIYDPSGLEDYQDISILVIDKPTVEIGVITNMEVPENVVSVEDPFYLSSAGTKPSNIPGTTVSDIRWAITYFDAVNNLIMSVPPFSPLIQQWVEPNPNNIIVPYEESLNINLIKPKILNVVTPHTIKLTIEQETNTGGLIIPSTFQKSEELIVKECIPFRGTSDPFPYSSWSDPEDYNNYISTNHACCLGDIDDDETYAVAGQSTSCYDETLYGERNHLIDEVIDLMKHDLLWAYYDLISIPQPGTTINVNGPQTDKNDVFKMYFERFCDGRRGNICAGSGEYTVSRLLECPNKLSNEIGTCTGPPETITSTQPTQCTNYPPGKTFESIFEGAQETRCNTNPACSTSTQYGTPGPLSCTAQCDNQGGCTHPVQCTCSQACGAQCYPGKLMEWIGTTCNFNCAKESTCVFTGNAQTPCSSPQSFCYNSIFNGQSRCYTNVGCDDTLGARYTAADYCAARGTILNYGGDRYCFFYNSINPPVPPNICTSGGNCLINSMSETNFINSHGPCNAGQQITCNPLTGWVCT